MSFVIAHFSDLHVLAIDGVPLRRFLNKRITGYANLRFKRKHIHRVAYLKAIARELSAMHVDHVAITGDMTNLALQSEFQLAKTLLEDELHLAPEHVSIVPGNHDMYTAGAARSKRFTDYFAPFTSSDLPDLSGNCAAGAFPFVRLRGPVAIIGLSSAVPRLPLISAGTIGSSQLAALTRILEQPQVEARLPVILCHHPIHNPAGLLDRAMRGLRDAAQLGKALDGLDRGLFLHGHLHERMHRVHRTAQGELASVGATSASLHHDEAARMAGFNLYEVSDDGQVVSIEARVFDPKTERFESRPVPLKR